MKWRASRAVVAALALAACARPPAYRPRPAAVPLPPTAPGPDAMRRAAHASGDARVLRFYDLRAFRPAWLDDSGARARELLEVLADAAGDGLDPARYDLSTTSPQLADTAHPETRAAADVATSRAALAFARDVAVGRADPRSIDSLWTAGNDFDFVAALAGIVDSGPISSLPERLRPPHPGYEALRGELRRVRTLAAADESTAVRTRLIELNLERWRWLPRNLGRRYLMIDIAAFEAAAVAGGAEALRTRVVAGRADWPTPIVSGRLTGIVVHPRWNVPRDIASQEILPILRSDSGYLARERMFVYRGSRVIDPATVDWSGVPDSAFPYRLVQDPGPRNPLGRVKLVFANPFNVALHDTPARELFARSERAASHGCVRAERAVDLALWAVGDSGASALRTALDGSEERIIPLAEPVHVHLVYFTAALDPGGRLEQRSDLYGWDEPLERALTP